jgi:type II secretory pathway component PulF
MRARRVFYEGLASQLDAGIPVRSALAQLSARAEGSYGEALRHLRAAVDAGRPLAEAMEGRPRAFRRFEVALVRAAETAGGLDRAARTLAADEEASDRVKRRLLVGLAYPALVLHLVPIPLNVASLVQGRPGEFLAGCLLWLLPLWALVGAGAWLWSRARTGGAEGRLLLGIPLLGGLLRDGAMVRWARAFAALEDAGIAPGPCTAQAAAVTGYAVLEGPLASPAAALGGGASRADAFAGAPLPPELYAALAQGETAGSIAASLRRTADVLEDRLAAKVKAAMALLPPIAVVIAGAAVAFAALRVLSGYYGLAR